MSQAPIELTATFPYGLLLVTDTGSADEIPSWQSASDQATASASSVVLRVRHEQEGDVAVRVWLGESTRFLGVPLFDDEIEVTSGVLSVGDIVGQSSVQVLLVAGLHRIALFTDAASEASEVDVLIDRDGAHCLGSE